MRAPQCYASYSTGSARDALSRSQDYYACPCCLTAYPREAVDRTWDLFLSYAREDADAVAHPLARLLEQRGMKVWLDAGELRVGDSLSGRIDEGLAMSNFGVVVVSDAFFAKHWPKRELAGLRAREEAGTKVVLPVWHEVDKAAVTSFSPTLADLVAVDTGQGLPVVADELVQAIDAAEAQAAGLSQSAQRRLTEALDQQVSAEQFTKILEPILGVTPRQYRRTGAVCFRKVRVGDVTFDASAVEIGNSLMVSLLRFTDCVNDPFTMINNRYSLDPSLLDTIHAVQNAASSVEEDTRQRTELLETLLLHHDLPSEYASLGRHHLLSHLPIYAGRRHIVNHDPERRTSWNRLSRSLGHGPVNVLTYDSIIDMFRLSTFERPFGSLW
jgi:hypothetical protein